jgi:hypothetical protein
MGLDMYLRKKTYVKNWEHTPDDQKHQVTVLKGGTTVTSINPDRVSYITEEVGYWRKANQIHRWFVDNVQEGNDDCGSYYVDREKLEELLDLVNDVLTDPAVKGPELLFGSYDYGEYYVEDLEETRKILTAVLAEEGGDFEYHSSW